MYHSGAAGARADAVRRGYGTYIENNAFAFAVLSTIIIILTLIAIVNPTNYNDNNIITELANAPSFIEAESSGGFNYHIAGSPTYGWVADSPAAIKYVCENNPGWQSEFDPIVVWAINKYIAT